MRISMYWEDTVTGKLGSEFIVREAGKAFIAIGTGTYWASFESEIQNEHLLETKKSFQD